MEVVADILAVIVVTIVVLAGAALVVLTIKDARASLHKDHQDSAQREADEHTFDLISKGKGGAV